jgi:hypothetical protein
MGIRHSDTQTLVLVWTLLLLDSVLIATIYLPLPRRIPYVCDALEVTCTFVLTRKAQVWE